MVPLGPGQAYVDVSLPGVPAGTTGLSLAAACRTVVDGAGPSVVSWSFDRVVTVLEQPSPPEVVRVHGQRPG